MTAKEIVKHQYGDSKNFMTPNAISYKWLIKDRLAYELATGMGFEGKQIYGLSFVEVEKYEKLENGSMVLLTKRRTDLGCVCHSKEEIKEMLKIVWAKFEKKKCLEQ